MNLLTGSPIEINQKKTRRSSWGGIQSRSRRGVHYFSDAFNSAGVGGFDEDRRPDRLLTDDQLWETYRRCADVRAAIDSIVRRVATFDWIVEPKISPQAKGYDELATLSQEITSLLAKPTQNGDTWQEIMTSFLTDVLVYDSGALELVYNREKQLTEIVPLQGSTITPVMDENGRIQYYTQNTVSSGNWSFYSTDEEDQKQSDVIFKPEQLILFSLYKNTSSPVGCPLIESLVNQVIALMRASENAMLTLDADEVPPGILVLTGISGRAAEMAKSDLQRLRGQDHKIRVMTTPDPQGVGASWLELKRTPKDIEMRSLIEDIRRSVYRVFGVMPVEMGMTDGMPRATATVQMDVAASHLVTPILELLQAKVNAMILPAIVGKEQANQLFFRFDRESRSTPDEQKKLSETHQIYIKNGVMTRNEVRERLGLLPIVGGDVATVDMAGTPSPISSFGKAPEEDIKEEEPQGELGEPVDNN